MRFNMNLLYFLNDIFFFEDPVRFRKTFINVINIDTNFGSQVDRGV